MKKSAFILLLALLETITSNPVSEPNSFVVSTTEKNEKENNNGQNKTQDVSVNPQIYSMEIQTNISNRFATTLVTSKVRNLKKVAAETTFSVILPENAFISEFSMEIDDKIYKAYVKEKGEAKKIYQEAVSRGQSAAHVEMSARDSKNFQVSVNIEPESKTTFRLTYEELLERQNGQYELIVNIHPGQIVDNLNVEVYVNESRPLSFVRTPSLRTGNEISKNYENLKPSADIEIINKTSAIVKFRPDKNEQTNFAGLLGTNKESGLAGQFVVQYDVERDPKGGEVLIRDGYFVHFFSPSDLEPLPKHVVFVLDHSGSMGGRKFNQLTEAMQNILSDLRVNDLFNIVRFTESASVWNPDENKFSPVNLINSQYGNLETQLREQNLPGAVEAIPESIKKAKAIIQDQTNMGLTNIIAGLEVGLFLIKQTQEKFPKKIQPMIIFLTDGLPNVGMHSGDQITDTVTKLNSGENRASIFSLSFGRGADKGFLRKLSSKNLGFSKHIYEAADASLQLQDFYSKISSPLLSNVTFKYVDGVTEITKTHYPFLFNGSELVVAGRIDNNDNIPLDVHGYCKTGLIRYVPIREEPISSIERLWAYLTVQQLLKERETATEPKTVTKKALDLAMKYSFVTDVTSLVVVKPNQTEHTESQVEDADNSSRKNRMYNVYPIRHSSQLSGISGPAAGGRSYFDALSVRTGYSSRRMFNVHSPIRPKAHTYNRLIPLEPVVPSGLSAQSSPQNFHPTTSRTIISTTLTTTPVATTAAISPSNTTLINKITVPKWLEDLQVNNQNITTPQQGSYKLGKSGDVTTYPSCPKTPLNSTGECKIIFDCPQVFSLLPDINTYLQYFCSLNEYAGVCCPKSTTSEP